MKFIINCGIGLYLIGLSYITIENYLSLKKIKKNSLKECKVIDYNFWGDFYENV